MLCPWDQKQVKSIPLTTDVIVLAILGNEVRPEKKEKASTSERKQQNCLC